MNENRAKHKKLVNLSEGCIKLNTTLATLFLDLKLFQNKFFIKDTNYLEQSHFLKCLCIK